MASGLIVDIKRYSVHDGPGIRTTVFLQGCPLSCAWCHNPETRPQDPLPAFRADRCLACLACTESCPEDVKPRPEAPWPDTCTQCGRCLTACPAEARELSARETVAAELVADIERDRLHFEESGGGVTFSGGEPLAQPEFLTALLTECRRRDLDTTVDTTLHAETEVLDSLVPLVNRWLVDLKHPDSARHLALTGVENTLILKNLEHLVNRGSTIWLRVPLVSGLTDDLEAIEKTGQLAARLGIRRLHLLPYHGTAAAKQQRFALEPATVDLTSPDPDHLDRLIARLKELGLDVHLGG